MLQLLINLLSTEMPTQAAAIDLNSYFDYLTLIRVY